MTDRRPRILVVDDDRAVVDALVEMLRDRYDVEGLVSAPEALHRVCAEDAEEIDLLITDVEMPQMRGLELLEAVQRRNPGQLVLLITAFGSIDLAVRAVRAGACDFMSKPFTNEALIVAIERTLRERTMRREVVRLRRELIGGERGLIASSAAIQRVLDTAARAARSGAPVLLTGESGVGKGAVARWIHERGPRATGPLIQVNCAALPSGLIEAELFGVRRGAFTDAREARNGLFAEASGGTIFLDEIAEMPPPAQAKLLQVLETSRVRPVGTTGEIEVDARVIAATNRPIEEAVKTGTFRSDLFYRLNVIPLEIPPLRARPEDIPDLVHAILERAARGEPAPIGIADDAMQWLIRQPWPGNVRQLANVLERAIALTDQVTGMIGALNRVVRFCSGRRPTIVNGHTDCGLPLSSKPGVVNELEKLISVSMPLCCFAAIVIPPLAAVCAGWRTWIDLAPCRNVDETCASLPVTACWLAAVVIDDDEPVHPAAAANSSATILLFPMIPPRPSYHCGVLDYQRRRVGNRLLTPFEHAVRPANNNAPIECRERLGGLLNFYYRRAA